MILLLSEQAADNILTLSTSEVQETPRLQVCRSAAAIPWHTVVTRTKRPIQHFSHVYQTSQGSAEALVAHEGSDYEACTIALRYTGRTAESFRPVFSIYEPLYRLLSGPALHNITFSRLNGRVRRKYHDAISCVQSQLR